MEVSGDHDSMRALASLADIDRIAWVNETPGDTIKGDGSEDLLWLYYSNVMRAVREQAWDWITVVTGYEGTGKSTLALWIAHICDSRFNVSQVAWEAEDMAQAIANTEPGGAALFDEGVNGLYAREAMGTENRSLTTMTMVARGRQVHQIICIPNLHNLDHYFREFRVATWIHVTRRGLATVHDAVRSPYREGVYWRVRFVHEYPDVPPEIKDPYLSAKMSYITSKLNAHAGKVHAKAGGAEPRKVASARRGPGRPPKGSV